MPAKRPKPEEIVRKLRKVEVLQSKGKTAAERAAASIDAVPARGKPGARIRSIEREHGQAGATA